ncbi:MAG: polymer-forming cytoskeletal protein [Phycisphaerales bacterium]|nr:polymer-forming cytoskeletal protein [Phycisphaerales bacterium]
MAADTGGDFPTIIGPDANFKGELRFEKAVKHLGRFEGTIESKGRLLVAEGASLSGDVKAETIDVQGEVKGNLHATGKVCLTSTAKLEGDLHTARLEVNEGAVFVGRCVVGANGARPTQESKPAAETKPAVDTRPQADQGRDRAAVGGKR